MSLQLLIFLVLLPTVSLGSNFKSLNDRVARSMHDLHVEGEVDTEFFLFVSDRLRQELHPLASFLSSPLVDALQRGALAKVRKDSDVTFAAVDGLTVACPNEDGSQSAGSRSPEMCNVRINDKGKLIVSERSKRGRDSYFLANPALNALRWEAKNLTVLRGSFSGKNGNVGQNRSWAGSANYISERGDIQLQRSFGGKNSALKADANYRILDDITTLSLTQESCPTSSFCQKTVLSEARSGSHTGRKIVTSIATGGDNTLFELGASRTDEGKKGLFARGGLTRNEKVYDLEAKFGAEPGETLADGTRSLGFSLKNLESGLDGVAGYKYMDSDRSEGSVGVEAPIRPGGVAGKFVASGSYKEKPEGDVIGVSVAIVLGLQ